jgi:hypothetical protein
MNRNKLRFEQRLHRRKWNREYWSKYHASMWQYGDNGYRRLLTTEEHLAFWERHHRETVQRINGICGKPIKRIV